MIEQFLKIMDDARRDQRTALPTPVHNHIVTLSSRLAEDFPIVVTLCGSTKFPDAFFQAAMDETLAGRIVISVGCFGHADIPRGAKRITADGDESTGVKQKLDWLHKRKIDMADEILVINVGGYIGNSTRGEIEYATRTGKTVRYLEPRV